MILVWRMSRCVTPLSERLPATVLPRIDQRLGDPHRFGVGERLVERVQAVAAAADLAPRHVCGMALERLSARRKCPASLPQQPRISRCLRLMCWCALIALGPTSV